MVKLLAKTPFKVFKRVFLDLSPELISLLFKKKKKKYLYKRFVLLFNRIVVFD